MSDTGLFIPPCCVDKRLPRAIMEAPRRALSFYTQGDVTMESFYRAISYIIQDPHVMVLTMPVIPFETAAFLAQCFERKWITDLVLSTQKDATSLLDKYLADYREHIIYTHKYDVTDLTSHLVLYSDKRALSICGPMLYCKSSATLMAYTMLYQPHLEKPTRLAYASPLLNVLHPDILRLRQKYRSGADAHISNRLYHFLNSHFPPYEVQE